MSPECADRDMQAETASVHERDAQTEQSVTVKEAQTEPSPTGDDAVAQTDGLTADTADGAVQTELQGPPPTAAEAQTDPPIPGADATAQTEGMAVLVDVAVQAEAEVAPACADGAVQTDEAMDVWVCSACGTAVPVADRDTHAAVCPAAQPSPSTLEPAAAAAAAADLTPQMLAFKEAEVRIAQGARPKGEQAALTRLAWGTLACTVRGRTRPQISQTEVDIKHLEAAMRDAQRNTAADVIRQQAELLRQKDRLIDNLNAWKLNMKVWPRSVVSR